LYRKINKSVPALRWNRVFFSSFAIGLILVFFLGIFRSSGNIKATDKGAEPASSRYTDYFESRVKWLLNHKRVKEYFIRGKTLYELLAGYDVPPQNIMRIGKAIKPFFDLSKAKEGQVIDIWLDKKSEKVEKISLELSSDKTLHVIKIGQNFLSSLVYSPNIKDRTIINGEVYNSFYQSAIDRGMPSGIIMDIADIFAWDIDFLVDIRPADRFQVIFDKYYRNGEYIDYGKILAVRFVNQKNTHESFYFTDSNGRSFYYNRKGESLRKAFLKSPLRYRRISSHFSLKRFHPILKIYRPHYGIDYAAPSGTPVESVGNGRITFIGWKEGYGRYIRVRHNHIYETGYGHLSSFAKGLKKGSQVKQGQVIGYVGSSGLATGPHLDFGVLKWGKFINPLSIKSPPVLRLKGEDRKRFNSLIDQMDEAWESCQRS